MPCTGVRVVEARVEFEEQPLRTPLVLSTGAISQVSLATATVTVATDDGRRADGRGAMYLSDLWAWPSLVMAHPDRDSAMRALCSALAATLPRWTPDARHPLHHGVAWEHAVDALAAEESRRRSLVEAIPRLAALNCLSIYDAALHDAFGRLLGVTSYATLNRELLPEDLSHYLGPLGEGRHLSEFVRRSPRRTLDAWMIVGKSDALWDVDAADLSDDLPNSVEGWIRGRGLYCFKLKIAGKELQADAERTAAVYRCARAVHDALGSSAQVRLTIDSNEGHADVAAVVEYLERLEALDRQAYNALIYVEQPTQRDLETAPFDMRPIAVRKPVLVDEGILSLHHLDLAREQGWNGLALKTCKGHSTALLCVAWAHLHGWCYALQDLTNPGLSMIHAAGFAARMETVNGIELNSPQFTPSANAAIAARHPGLVHVTAGQHTLAHLDTAGLGY
jgi:L-alanine-DL-glutamate epimerase-like enolase superfamily enzyme